MLIKLAKRENRVRRDICVAATTVPQRLEVNHGLSEDGDLYVDRKRWIGNQCVNANILGRRPFLDHLQ